MKNHLLILKRFLFSFFFSFLYISGWGQTDPAVQSLPFSFTGMTSGSTTLPTGMAMHRFGTTAGAIPTTRTTIAATGDLPYASTGSTSGGWRNETTNGISLLASGSQSAGALVVAISTTGKTNINISWKAGTILQQASYDNSIALQYRIGTSGTWSDIGTTSTYTSQSKLAGDMSSLFTEQLPTLAENQATIQLRWIYWSSNGSSGSRDRINIDEISVTAATGHTVTFNSNGGSGTMSNQTSSTTANLTTNTFSRTGYTFTNWNTATDGTGTTYTDGQSYDFSADITLYAQWAINQYSVTYDGNGNTGGSAPGSQNGNYNSNITLATNSGGLTKTGYTFNGWNTAADGSGTHYNSGASFTIPASNITLYAEWLAIGTHTVTFNSNGGSGTMSSQIANTATNLTANTFTKTGYTFANWNTATDGTGTTYTNGQSYDFSADITLYAQWVINQYSVTYDGNGNTGGTAPATQNGNYNTTLTVSGAGTLVKTGYVFTGWNTAANGSGTTYATGATFTIPAANTTLYAQWDTAECSELFISEYHDPTSGNDKFIELYNPTSSAITLSNYRLVQYNNGATSPGTYTLSLSGSIAAYSTYVIANSSATLYTGNLSTTSNVMTFNGNDVIALQTSGGTNIDVVGVIGSSSNFAVDVDLVRKATVSKPTTTYNSAEWNSTAANNVTNLGSHTSNCYSVPEINVVQGATNIISGDTYNFGNITNNTSSSAITFTIQNTGNGILNLTGTPIIAVTGDTTYFTVGQSSLPSSIAGAGSSTFTVTFNPTTLGTKNLQLSIANNDSDENPYIINIIGISDCGATATALPDNGPVGTIVTIATTPSTIDLSGATATLSGKTATILSSSLTQLVISIPNGATSGDIIVNTNSGCSFNIPFTINSFDDTSCASATVELFAPPTDLFISEVTDSPTGSLTYVEIYNGTGSSINFASTPYTIKIYNNGSTSTPTTNNILTISSGTLPDSNVAVIAMGAPATTSSSQCYVTGGDGTLTENYIGINTTSGGINFDVNGSDFLGLYKGSSSSTNLIDSFGVYGDKTWSNGILDNNASKGADFRRNISGSLPNTSFTASDWTIYTWADCSAVDYSDIGNDYLFSSLYKLSPTVTSQPSFSPSCDSITLSVSASEGSADLPGLAYQWYVLPTGSNSWTPLSNGGVYSGVTTNQLIISSSTGLNNYQYYCQVRENTITCYKASNAVRIKDNATTWNAGIWTNGSPVLTSNVTINDIYDTETNGSLNACILTVNSGGGKITIKPEYPVTVDRNIINNAGADNFIVESDGSLIQNTDGYTNTGNITVKRNALLSAERKEYNFISSPVTIQNLKNIYTGDISSVGNASVTALYYNTATDYFGTSSGANITGRGLAIKEAPSTLVNYTDINNPADLSYDLKFIGIPYNSPAGPDYLQYTLTLTGDKYNLVGNPYPSNIDIKALYDASTNISNTFYFWDNTVNTLYTQMGSSYTGASYGMFNVDAGGGVGNPAPGNDLNSGTGDDSTKIPTRYVKPGQGFIVQATGSTNGSSYLTFKNTERSTNSSSTPFFGKTSSERDLYRLKLITPNHLSMTLTVVYYDGGINTFGKDDSVLNTSPSDAFFSYIDEKYLAIQGKSLFNSQDVITLGSRHFESGIYTMTLKNKEGIFENGQSIYLKDKQEHTLTDLTKGDYSFTSGAGEFINRFEIVYEPESTLGTQAAPKENILIYKDGQDFVIKSSGKAITDVEIYDISGKLVQKRSANSKEVKCSSSSFTPGVYIIKTTLEYQEIITKKIRK